jgi:hypothetical protein
MHRIKLQQGEAMCAAMPSLDYFRPDGTRIMDSEKAKTAYIEYNRALQLEKQRKKSSAGGFSLSSSKQVGRLVNEIQEPTDYVNNLIASYGLSDKHKAYLLGKTVFNEDEHIELERERIDNAKLRRDAVPARFASALRWTPIKAGTSMFAHLTEDAPSSGLLDNWFNCKQASFGLFFAEEPDVHHARVVTKKDGYVLRFDAESFADVFSSSFDEETFENVALFLRFVMRKICKHTKLHHDVTSSIRYVAGQLERGDVIGICAETSNGTVYLPNRQHGTELLKFFDQESISIKKPTVAPAADWDTFLDELF